MHVDAIFVDEVQWNTLMCTRGSETVDVHSKEDFTGDHRVLWTTILISTVPSFIIMALHGFRKYTRLDTKLELQPISVVMGKKKSSCRSWIRFDTLGISEILELDRSNLVDRVGIPARDLRILGPIFSQSSSILGEIPRCCCHCALFMLLSSIFTQAVRTLNKCFLAQQENGLWWSI